MGTPKAIWDAFSTKSFCEICKEEVIAGNRPSGVLSAVGYRNLEEKFFVRTKKRLLRKQFKNKWDFMKAEYVLWIQLKNAAIGLGQSATNNSVTADDDWWDRQIAANKAFVKFRHGAPANLECLEVMYDRAYVTGETATIPGMEVDAASTPVELVEGSGSSAEEEIEELTSSGSKKRKKELKGKGKMNSKEAKDSKYFAVFKKTADSISSHYTPSVQSPQVTVPTIKEVVQMMIDCGAKVGTPLFFTACNLALKPEIRELFVVIPCDEGRFDYLQRAHARGD